MRTAIELGPKGKISVAYAIDWPGLERNGVNEELALERMEAYRTRYQQVASGAGLCKEFANEPVAQIVETYEGTGFTDFWGISFAHSALDRVAIDNDELEKRLVLLQSCWAEFDGKELRVSAELQKGPRGGGRDRDQIVRHLLATEVDWMKRIGFRYSIDEVLPAVGRAE